MGDEALQPWIHDNAKLRAENARLRDLLDRVPATVEPMLADVELHPQDNPIRVLVSDIYAELEGKADDT